MNCVTISLFGDGPACNISALGLSTHLRRIKDPSTMQIWKELVEEYMTTISMNPITISNIFAEFQFLVLEQLRLNNIKMEI